MTPGPCPICYIGELGPVMSVNRNVPNLGPRLSIVDASGKRLARIGGRHAGVGRGEFIAPHGIAVDTRGDVYIGEVCRSAVAAEVPAGWRCSSVKLGALELLRGRCVVRGSPPRARRIPTRRRARRAPHHEGT
jgi:hypothetical protein